jgi:hypothetical protein
MPFDAFALVNSKLEEADTLRNRMGQVIIHPRHKPGFPAALTAMVMSCPEIIVAHDWHKEFEATLNAFLPATRCVPDIITKQVGYDTHGGDVAWLSSLDDEETKRRKKFQRKFEKKVQQFRQHPLSKQRNEVCHYSGVPNWEVRVRGRFETYIGGPMNPLPAVEKWPIIHKEDPVFWELADSSPRPLEPTAADFWWVIADPIGPTRSLPLFDECRAYVKAARDLAVRAHRLYQEIHQGHTLTKPPR